MHSGTRIVVPLPMMVSVIGTITISNINNEDGGTVCTSVVVVVVHIDIGGYGVG